MSVEITVDPFTEQSEINRVDRKISRSIEKLKIDVLSVLGGRYRESTSILAAPKHVREMGDFVESQKIP